MTAEAPTPKWEWGDEKTQPEASAEEQALAEVEHSLRMSVLGGIQTKQTLNSQLKKHEP